MTAMIDGRKVELSFTRSGTVKTVSVDGRKQRVLMTPLRVQVGDREVTLEEIKRAAMGHVPRGTSR